MKTSHKFVRKINISMALFLSIGVSIFLGISGYVLASSTSSFNQTINPGALSVDIVDAAYATVASPSVVMNATTFSFACQDTTGVFGTASQALYVKNPDAADGGWSLSIAASSPTAFWDSAGTDMDFNDPTSSGCLDGADTDSLKGQMTINPSGGTLSAGACASCGVTGITKGSSNSFSEGTVNSITLLTAAAGSDDIGDWKLSNVAISQKIPAEQPAAGDYAVNLTLSVTSS